MPEKTTDGRLFCPECRALHEKGECPMPIVEAIIERDRELLEELARV